MKFLQLATILTGLLLSLNSCNQTNHTGSEFLPVKKYLSELESTENALLIDVRTPKEYAEGIIGNAKNVDFYHEDFEKMAAELDTSKHLFIYCRSGNRSQQSVAIWQKAGFKKITDLKGGYNAYAEHMKNSKKE